MVQITMLTKYVYCRFNILVVQVVRQKFNDSLKFKLVKTLIFSFPRTSIILTLPLIREHKNKHFINVDSYITRFHVYFKLNNLAKAHVAILLKCKRSFIVTLFFF